MRFFIILIIDISLFVVQVNCVGAPFTDEGLGVDYAWWNDINGDVRNFWSGDDETAHTCQCGIDGNCIRTDLKCNCDANVAVSLSDIGILISIGIQFFCCFLRC